MAHTMALPARRGNRPLDRAPDAYDVCMKRSEDGRLEIDNNRAERSLRPFAVGRKNWLFFQTPNGGLNAAILMTLVRTATCCAMIGGIRARRRGPGCDAWESHSFVNVPPRTSCSSPRLA